MVTRKSYILIDTKAVKIHEMCALGSTLYPNLMVFRDSWVAVVGDGAMMFECRGKPMPSGLDLQATSKSSPIFQLSIMSYYLIALREAGAVIFNLLDSTKLQEIDFGKGWSYKDYAIDGNNVYIAHDLTMGSKKEPASGLIHLKAIPAEEQIKRLLRMADVSKAIKVFQQNNQQGGPSYEAKKERFNLEAAWTLFVSFNYVQAIEFFQQVNYDPKELLALVPELALMDSSGKLCKSLRSIIEERDDGFLKLESALKSARDSAAQEQDPERKRAAEEEVQNLDQSLKSVKASSAPRIEACIVQGYETIIHLVEEKRKYLESKYDIATEGGKPVSFLSPEQPINVMDKTKIRTVEKVVELLDTSLLKMFILEHKGAQLYSFINRTPILKCNEKQMDAFIAERKDKDRSFTTHMCQALLADRFGNYTNALEIWKSLASETREVRDIACKETVKLLRTKVEDKAIVFKYAKMLIIVNPDEGLRFFTENESISKIATEDDVLAYLEGLESLQPQIRERYLEYLINKKDNQDHFYTLLALLYVNRIKDDIAKYKTADKKPESTVQNRKILMNFLKEHNKYNPRAILDEVKDLDLFEEEIYLYSKQKMHSEALTSLVKMGTMNIEFNAAEEYCNDNPEPLLAMLFEKVVGVYLKEKQARGAEYDKKRVDAYEAFCKDFLKRYATDEKMNTEAILETIPDDWTFSGNGDDSLIQYLTLTFNDRLGKQLNAKIAKRALKMEKLDVECTLLNRQRAYILINPGNICKVCRKKLDGGRTFCVYPNGIVIHSNCAKDYKVCPVTKINFAKKVYI